MKSILFSIIVLFISPISFSQSFEGELAYEITLQTDSVTLKKFKNSIAYQQSLNPKPKEFRDTLSIMVKNGNYRTTNIIRDQKKIIYLKQDNTIYPLEHGSNRVITTHCRKSFGIFEPIWSKRLKPNIILSDSMRVINGLTCKLLLLEFGDFGYEEYWYNEDTLQLDWKRFKNHNYYYLNKILKETRAIPVEIVKFNKETFPKKLRLKLVSVNEKEMSSDLFQIPKLVHSRSDDPRFLNRRLGRKYMKIEN